VRISIRFSVKNFRTTSKLSHTSLIHKSEILSELSRQSLTLKLGEGGIYCKKRCHTQVRNLEWTLPPKVDTEVWNLVQKTLSHTSLTHKSHTQVRNIEWTLPPKFDTEVGRRRNLLQKTLSHTSPKFGVNSLAKVFGNWCTNFKLNPKIWENPPKVDLTL